MMSSLLRLTRLHYGAGARPIIILSERDPAEYVGKRLPKHGQYTRICKPRNMTSFEVKAVDRTNLEGGPFDAISCMREALERNQTAHPPSDAFLSFKDVEKLDRLGYIVDAMDDYQNALASWEVLRYNMFVKEGRTEVEDLAKLVTESLRAKMLRSDGTLRMNKGEDFRGMDLVTGGGKSLEEFDRELMGGRSNSASPETLSDHAYMVPFSHAQKFVLSPTWKTKCSKDEREETKLVPLGEGQGGGG